MSSQIRSTQGVRLNRGCAAIRWEQDSRTGGWRRVPDRCDDDAPSTRHAAGPGAPVSPVPSTSRWGGNEDLWEQHTIVEVTQTHRLTNKKERERLIEAGVSLRPGENRLFGENSLAAIMCQSCNAILIKAPRTCKFVYTACLVKILSHTRQGGF